jgi:hypothetical protein
VLAAAVASIGASGAQASPKLTECQHPVITGEEAYHHDVTAKTACRVVLDLGRWENKRGNIAKLYKCVGVGKHTPVLKLRSFEGWQLSLTKSGAFQMSRGHASFDVTGTDFPLNCT